MKGRLRWVIGVMLPHHKFRERERKEQAVWAMQRANGATGLEVGVHKRISLWMIYIFGLVALEVGVLSL